MDFCLSPMDLDFDLDDDRIRSFLLNKLEEIKAKNEKNVQMLQERRQFLRKITENSNCEMDETNIKISPQVWKKIFNGNYVLGVTVENGGSRCLSNLKAILKWNSSLPFQYQVFLYEEKIIPKLKSLTSPTFICRKENCCGLTNSLKKSDVVTESGHLVVVVKRPTFVDELSYTISGNIIFQCGDKNIDLVFPLAEISAFDSTTASLHNLSLPSGDTKDIMTAVSCSEKADLLMILPEDWPSSFDSTFEILCSLTKVSTAVTCRKVFVANRLCPHFDDSLLVFHAPTEASIHTYDVTVYARNEDSLLSLLHHLHQNIPGVLVIPKKLHENYIQQHPEYISVEKEISQLRECIKKEVNLVKNFLHEAQGSRNPIDKNGFIEKFADMQMDTDLHYVRLLKTTCHYKID